VGLARGRDKKEFARLRRGKSKVFGVDRGDKTKVVEETLLLQTERWNPVNGCREVAGQVFLEQRPLGTRGAEEYFKCLGRGGKV